MAKIFVSYAHADESYKDTLVNIHLKPMQRDGWIDSWDDRQILPGTAWNSEIKEQLEAADIILFLVSPDFMASDYIHDVEIKKALERHERGEVRVVPIIIRPCDWGSIGINQLQALPKDAKPISRWEDADEAWLDVVKGIKKIIQTPPSGTPNTPPGATENNSASSPTQDISGQKQALTALIAQGSVKKALESLLEVTSHDEDLNNQAILLNARFNSLERDRNSGTISTSDAGIRQNQITSAMLSLIRDLEE